MVMPPFLLLAWGSIMWALAGMPREWAAPTALGVLVVFILVLFPILRAALFDRAAFRELNEQLSTTERQVEKLEDRVSKIEQERDEQRHLKHEAIQELARADLIIHIVNDLKANCTDGALSVLTPILDRYVVRSQEREAARRESDRLALL